MLSYIFLLLLSCASSAPIERNTPPTVTISNGTVVGVTLFGVDSFRGIPYAQPPVGDLRLRPPQPLTSSFGTFTTQRAPAACPQFWSKLDSGSLPKDVMGIITNSHLFERITSQSEDCLTLTVQRPAGTLPSTGLPVVVWIFGGAFAVGDASTYDGTRVIEQSVGLGQPIIYVAINYRLGGFGFLPGKEVSANGSSNLGLKDQRLALKWVQENIGHFGGDPSKVTLWGESAGAISACDHTIIDGGDISYNGGNLFRGAILNSGSTTPTVPIDHPKAQAIYDAVVEAAGCTGAGHSLDCLRALPYQQLSDAFASVPSFFSYSSVDLSYLPRPDPIDSFLHESPEMAMQNGNFAKVPIIIGDQEDEGTLFSLTQTNISTTEQIIAYLTPMFPLANESIVAGLVNAYPDDPSAGSPFNTLSLNNIYPQFKRLAAMLGDVTFTLQRRSYLASIASQVPAWSYLAKYLPLTPVLGTFHASDVFSAFFDVPLVPTMENILIYYISFINHLDPNAILGSKTWPQYDTNDKEMLEFGTLSFDITTDNFRGSSYEFFSRYQDMLRI